MRVLSIVHVRDLDEAFVFLEKSRYGNQASLFTSSGAAARRFRYEAPAGNIGINIGVAAPMAYFPFSGWKDSFFGDLHAQGGDSIEFYTHKKVVVERWSTGHSRKFWFKIADAQIQHAASDRVATATLHTVFPGLGEILIAIAIMVSTFGCMNGASSRVASLLRHGKGSFVF
jgi:hypothetical protein